MTRCVVGGATVGSLCTRRCILLSNKSANGPGGRSGVRIAIGLFSKISTISVRPLLRTCNTGEQAARSRLVKGAMACGGTSEFRARERKRKLADFASVKFGAVTQYPARPANVFRGGLLVIVNITKKYPRPPRLD